MGEFIDLRYKVLRMLQIFTIGATGLATMSNLLNHRPLHVVAQPLFATIFILSLWQLEKYNPKWKYISKLIFMFFFNVIYLPVAWYYSPGITSAIGYYAILTIVLSVFFVEKTVEFLLPIFSLVISIGMIRFELYNPSHFHPFVSKTVQMNDVTMNFTIVTMVMFLTISYINRTYEKEKERFYRQSITDELTGLYNRRYLLNSLERLSKKGRIKDSFAVLFIDVNNFKRINDNFGHHIGDEALIELGLILKEYFHVCGRFGGDEFIGIVHATEESARKIGDQVILKFKDYTERQGFDGVSLSIGVTMSDDKTAAEMIKEADSYMYDNKHGRCS